MDVDCSLPSLDKSCAPVDRVKSFSLGQVDKCCCAVSFSSVLDVIDYLGASGQFQSCTKVETCVWVFFFFLLACGLIYCYFS